MYVAFDNPAIDSEIDTFYGKPKSTRIEDEMRAILTKTIRKIPAKSLVLDCITYRGGIAKLSTYAALEVVTDYGTERAPLAALATVLEQSDCPLVAAYRESLAETYIRANADAVIDFLGEEV